MCLSGPVLRLQENVIEKHKYVGLVGGTQGDLCCKI
jgi:hypothetical protein